MRLKRTQLFKESYSDKKDKMGNRLKEKILIEKGQSRLANWSNEEVSLMGRDVSLKLQKILYKGSAALDNEADYIQIEDSPLLEIKEIKWVGRWAIFVVKRWR